MENFLEKVAELMEEDQVNLTDELESFDAWDSLTVLSLIAMSDEDYGVTLSAADVQNAKTIGGLHELILSKK